MTRIISAALWLAVIAACGLAMGCWESDEPRLSGRSHVASERDGLLGVGARSQLPGGVESASRPRAWARHLRVPASADRRRRAMIRWTLDLATKAAVVSLEAAVLAAIMATATAFEVIDAVTWIRDERARRRA